MAKRDTKKKNKSVAGMAIPACLFIGMGIGFMGNLVAWMFIGLGIGFIAFLILTMLGK